MKKTIRLSIPKPCSANWNEMTPNEQGKFCSLCHLTVVDFTQMNEAAIKEYFECHVGQKTCGRFKSAQLTKKESLRSKKTWAEHSFLSEKSIYFHNAGIILLFCLSIFAFLTGCRKSPITRPHLMGDVEFMGKPALEKIDPQKTDSSPNSPLN